MAADDARVPARSSASSFWLVALVLVSTVALSGTTMLVAWWPTALGPILVAVFGIGIVGASLTIQYKQFALQRREFQYLQQRELIRLAMENPRYRQCWGPSVAPNVDDEDLFYYCNHMIDLWLWAWECRHVDTDGIRRYLQLFFDSEVPRQFWERYNSMNQNQGPGTRRGRLNKIIDEEYLRAIKAGPPARIRRDGVPPFPPRVGRIGPPAPERQQ